MGSYQLVYFCHSSFSNHTAMKRALLAAYYKCLNRSIFPFVDDPPSLPSSHTLILMHLSDPCPPPFPLFLPAFRLPGPPSPCRPVLHALRVPPFFPLVLAGLHLRQYPLIARVPPSPTMRTLVLFLPLFTLTASKIYISQCQPIQRPR